MLNGLTFPLALLLAAFGIREVVLKWSSQLPTSKIVSKALLVFVCAGLAYEASISNLQEYYGRAWMQWLAVAFCVVAAVCMAVVLTRQLWMRGHRS